MLVLTLELDEWVSIDGETYFGYVKRRGKQARIGIIAPRGKKIDRLPKDECDDLVAWDRTQRGKRDDNTDDND